MPQMPSIGGQKTAATALAEGLAERQSAVATTGPGTFLNTQRRRWAGTMQMIEPRRRKGRDEEEGKALRHRNKGRTERW